MATRWTVTFKTLNDKTGIVKIGDADYTGNTPVKLRPASNPFSVSRTQEDMLTPVMSDTGYLRILDMGDADAGIEDMYPEGALDRPVEFYLDNELIWRGYISPEAFSADYTPAPVVMEFPLVSALDVLASVNIEDTGVGLQPVGTFLAECLDATGFDWNNVIYPRQLLQVGSFTEIGELRLELSRYNFLKLNDMGNIEDEDWTDFNGDSYLKVLSEICRYFGWTASQQGADLLLTTPRTDIEDYASVTVSDLEQLKDEPSVEPDVDEVSRHTIDSLVADGTAHRRSKSNGYKRVTVRTSLNEARAVYPELLFNGAVEAECSRDFTEHIDIAALQYDIALKGMCKALNIDRENVKLFRYVLGQNDRVIELVYDYPNSDVPDTWSLIGADLVKCFTYNRNDAPPSYNFISALRLFCDDGANRPHFRQDYPLARITSRGVGSFPSGGALCINATVQNSYLWHDDPGGALSGWLKEPYGLTQWGPFFNNLRVSLKIGNYYYNGTTWTTSPAIFNIKAGTLTSAAKLSENSVGTVSNTMTFELPYDGANGYIIPIDRHLHGKMELTFWPWIINHGSAGGQSNVSYAALYISNLSVNYFNDGLTVKDTEGLRLSSLTGKRFMSEREVSLALTSDQNNRTGLALLWFNGTPVGKVNLSYPGNQTLQQPERWLLQTLLKLYGKPSTKLELEVEYDSTIGMSDLVVADGHEHIITGMNIDYADEHMTITLMNYE